MEVFHRSNPDVVLLDLMLPGSDGYDICRDIRRESDVCRLLCSPLAAIPLTKLWAWELGADDYVQKPFEP